MMYSFSEIIDKLDKLQIFHQPVTGVENMEQLGKRDTTIHCANGVYILYATDADMSAVLGYSWDSGICVERDAKDKSREACNEIIESNTNKITCLREGNHSMNASAPKYQPHRIYVYSDNHLDTILDILTDGRKAGGKKGMTKIDCIWIAAAALAYDVCIDNANWSLEDVYFSQQEIIAFAKNLIGDEIPNALVSQHACAYSNSQNRNCMYLVAKDVKRRISYSGEFCGKTERPDFSEMKNNIQVVTKHGSINIEELIRFVDEVYTPRMKQLLEEYFSQYDLGSVFDYIKEYEGKHFVAVEKAGDQAASMEEHKRLGTFARSCVKGFSEEIKSCMPRFEKTDITGWINQGQNTDEYIWAQLRQKAKADLPTSLSVFFERMRIDGGEKKFELRISIEAQDSKCGRDAEKYYRHARLLNVEKKPGLDYYVGGSLPGELHITNKAPAEILDDLHSSKNKKVQICKVMSEEDVRSKSSYEVYKFMIQAAYELEPYYNAAVADDGVVEDMSEEGSAKMISTNGFVNPNMILYGPPGTGKTYNSVVYAVAIVEGKTHEEVAGEPYEEIKARYDEYFAAGQIAFTTFHQSYGYEEFIEGIKPATDDSTGAITYSVEDGAFKAFCKRAEIPEMADVNHSAKVWKIILKNEKLNDLKQECFAEGVIRVDLKTAEEHEGQYNYYQVGHFRDKMEIGDFVMSYAGKSTLIDAIGIIEGDAVYDETRESFRWSRKVNWLVTGISEDIYKLNGSKLLSGDLFCVQRNINISELMRLVPTYTVADSTKNYVFIIDEINRGNISKIFGELITLIEDTKRKGKDEQATAILPYSGSEFSVPSNVYILGTMNTADRSIALMDTALRRRFSFIEMMPQAKLLNDVHVSANGVSVNIGEMLDVINKRIEFLFDREHTIGHAFFMRLKKNPDISVLADIFKRSVVPLLQEYFYEDYEKIQLVLGDNGKSEDKHKFIKNETITPSSLFRGRSRLEKSSKYTINEDAFQWIDSYVGILNPVDDSVNDEE